MRNRSENQITLVLIRHGATKANEEKRYLGRADESLTEEGKKELSEYRASEYYPAIDCLFASPMKRCMETAAILYPDLQPVPVPEWEEMDFGTFEGRNYTELQGDVRYQAWIDSNGTLPFPEGESREDFIRRCVCGFQRMAVEIKKFAEEVKTVGMIVHGGTIMALLSRYGGGDYFDYQAANGKGYVCICKGGNSQPEFMQIRKIWQEEGL